MTIKLVARICMRDAISIYARVEILKQFTVPIYIEKKYLCIDHAPCTVGVFFSPPSIIKFWHNFIGRIYLILGACAMSINRSLIKNLIIMKANKFK